MARIAGLLTIQMRDKIKGLLLLGDNNEYDDDDNDDDDVAVPKSLSYTYITHVTYLTPSVPHKWTVCDKS